MPNEKLGMPSLSRYLRPDKFDIEPDVADADEKWVHWKSTFVSFLAEEITDDVPDSIKRKLLVNHLSASIYKHIKTCSTYKDSMKVLEDIIVKPKNTILARHILFIRKQRADETISDSIRALRLSAKDCKFEDVIAQEHEDQAIRSALISGLLSRRIREWLLENSKLTLSEALNQAVALETAEKDAVAIGISSTQLTAISQGTSRDKESENLAAAPSSRTFQAAPTTPPPAKPCFFCGGSLHPRFRCPANKATCKKCSKKGHFASVCRSGNINLNSTTVEDPTTSNNNQFYSGAISAASPLSLRSATIPIMVNEYKADALVDTGSSVSFINASGARIMKLHKKPCKQTVNLASLNQVSFAEGICFATITMNKHTNKQTPLLVVDNLCADVIVGHDLLKHHSSIYFNLGGPGEPLEICNVLRASVPPASVFTNLSPNIRPIAVRSRRYSKEDEDFIKEEVSKLLEDGSVSFGQPLYIHSDRGSSFMSEEFKSFLRQSNIASSRTTPYNPQGNGQVKRLNGTLWRTIQLSLWSKGLSVENWEVALKDALHCVRSLMCTATNATPHEKLFTYPKRSPNGDSLPSWLTPGPILVKKNVRSSNTDPLVKEAELLDTNPYYSLIRRDNGETSTVSNRQLAPFPSITDNSSDDNFEMASEDDNLRFPSENNSTPPPENIAPSSPPRVGEPSTTSPVLRTGLPRRFNRTRKLPSYLADFVVDGSESEN
ncbi:unnamed protein product, partial [Brenthis ino]